MIDAVKDQKVIEAKKLTHVSEIKQPINP